MPTMSLPRKEEWTGAVGFTGSGLVFGYLAADAIDDESGATSGYGVMSPEEGAIVGASIGFAVWLFISTFYNP